jgi:hypothetical protein
MLGIWILVRVDPDLIGQIRILERTSAVYSPIGLRVVANAAGSENLDFTSMDALYSVGCSFKTVGRKKVSANLSLGLNLCSIDPS